jgi:uncharacterized membrane protein YphA (DoxX/SURF4 family)
MKRAIDNPVLILVLRLAVAGIFIGAAYSKILDPAAFAKSVNNYHILPGTLVNVFAFTLPWLELLAAIGLLTGIWFRSSALLINGMMVMFLVGLIIAMATGVSINCGCFTQNPEVKSDLWVAFWRDIGFIALSVPLLFTRARGFCLKPE